MKEKIRMMIRYSLPCQKIARQLCKVMNKELENVEVEREEISYSDKSSRQTFRWLEIVKLNQDGYSVYFPSDSITLLKEIKRKLLFRKDSSEYKKGNIINRMRKRYILRRMLKILQDALVIFEDIQNERVWKVKTKH